MSIPKWALFLLAVMVVLVILYQFGRKTFYAEIIIPAAPDDVWRVLMDGEGYRDWHPLLVPIEGRFAEKAKVTYQMSQQNGKQSEFVTTIVRLSPSKHLRQYAGVPLIITADHEYRLEPVPEGTRVIQYEVDNGFGMFFWDSSWVQPAYQKVNVALKNRVLELQGK